VTSVEFGRLLFFRVRNDESLIVNLPVSAQRGTMLTLLVSYSGRIPSQTLDRETVTLEAQDDDAESMISTEPNFLLSSRSAWYPQNVITDYARARIRVTVPDGYDCVGSGQLTPGDVSLAIRSPTAAAPSVQRERAGSCTRLSPASDRASEVIIDARPEISTSATFRSDGRPCPDAG
jgi:hypothetical protein